MLQWNVAGGDSVRNCGAVAYVDVVAAVPGVVVHVASWVVVVVSVVVVIVFFTFSFTSDDEALRSLKRVTQLLPPFTSARSKFFISTFKKKGGQISLCVKHEEACVWEVWRAVRRVWCAVSGVVRCRVVALPQLPMLKSR